MSVVWKYELGDPADEYVAQMPEHARVLHAGIQHNKLVIWALVHATDTVPLHRRFLLRGTGHPVPERARHIATWTDGPFVWHLFELHPTRRDLHQQQGETDEYRHD